MRSRSRRQLTRRRARPPSVVRALRLMYLDRLDEARDSRTRCGAQRIAGTRRWSRRCASTARGLELRAGDWTRAAELTDQISELAGQDLGHRSGLRAWIRAQSLPTKETRTHGIRGRRRDGGRGSRIRELEMQALLGFSSSREGTR